MPPLRSAALLFAGWWVIAGLAARPSAAQGVTTSAIRGTVVMGDGGDPDGSRVTVWNAATGYTNETEVHRGRFLVQGLEIGGPYRITVRRIGILPWVRQGVILTLGEPLELRVVLQPVPLELDSLVAVDSAPPVPLRHGGTATTLDDSLIHRLPSLNRDVYDFLRLVPQLSTRIGFPSGGISGGGVGFRLNQFLTNGVPERSLGGGQPPEFAGGKSLPFEAVSEYQVLLAPFDVRYGDFAGAMVNTVTRSGTNRLGASAFVQGRSDDLARRGTGGALPYERWQFGGSVAGPLLRDRAHFFAAAEFQDLSAPMLGPYVGQPDGSAAPVPVSSADLGRLTQALRQYGLEPGSGGAVPTETNLRNLFARVDAALPWWNSRAVLWLNDSHTRSLPFSRGAAPDTFALTTNAAATVFGTRTVALQLFTPLSRTSGGQNQLSLSRRSIPFRAEPEVRQPLVQVVIPDTAGRRTVVVSGPPQQAHSGESRAWNVNLRDELTLPLGDSHEATVGFEIEWFRLGAAGVRNAFGTWTFSSLDSLEAGLADRYELSEDFGSASTPLTGRQFGVFAGDYWRMSDRFSLSFGLRTDLLAIDHPPPYNLMVDSLFGRRTDRAFPRTLLFSPRVGFTWEPGPTLGRLRGGLGIFTGRPPLAWLQVPLQNYGEGIGALRCGSRPGDLGLPPIFNPDPDHATPTCAGGQGLGGPPRGDVELIAADLRMAQTFRGALAWEHRLPGALVGTLEALVTRNISDYAFVNLNLAGPLGTDSRGRVLYGSLDTLGRSRPARVTDSLPSVIELRNVSRNYSVQLSASLVRRWSGGFVAMASYTWSRVRDTQTPLRINNRGVVNWSSRAVSGRHNDLTPGISLNDVPHRVTLAGTWRAPWRGWTTEVSLMYVGESGSPFTWLTGGSGGRGDLNADGALNDPVYVPRAASDPAEILFDGVSSEAGADNSPAAQAARIQSQQAAFESFVGRTPCLRERRGHIIARNSCREPWTHTTLLSVRQAIPLGSGALETEVDLFNILNLLDSSWGQRRLAPTPFLLDHVGMAIGPSGQPEPTFHFTPSAARWRVEPSESAFQFQVGARYRF